MAMNNRRYHTMADAARAVGMGRTTLFRLLRSRGYFSPDNQPARELLRQGFFHVDTRGFTHPTTGRHVLYQRVTVTPAGLQWLQELVDASRTTDSTSAVGGRDRRSGVAAGAPNTATAGAGPLPAAGGNPFETHVGASPSNRSR